VSAPGLQQRAPGASRVVMPGCAGTRGPMDVVEVPSHLLEHFARAPAVLAAAGRHWRTREPPPSQLLDALARRERLFGALRLQQQARAGAAVPRPPAHASVWRLHGIRKLCSLGWASRRCVQGWRAAPACLGLDGAVMPARRAKRPAGWPHARAARGARARPAGYGCGRGPAPARPAAGRRVDRRRGGGHGGALCGAVRAGHALAGPVRRAARRRPARPPRSARAAERLGP